MIKAVFFDIDNTLIDFMTMKHKSCEAAINAMIAAGLKVERKKAATAGLSHCRYRDSNHLVGDLGRHFDRGRLVHRHTARYDIERYNDAYAEGYSNSLVLGVCWNLLVDVA